MDSSTPSREQLVRQVRALQARLHQLEGGPEADAPSADGDIERLGRYASTIAHDLNNLLVGILGNAGLALMDLSSFSSCRPLIQEVEEAALRAASLANEMVSFTGKIQAAVSAQEADVSDRVAADRLATDGGVPDRGGRISMPATSGMGWRGEGLLMVVDDEPMVRVLAQRVLEKFGFQVMTAEDGRQAIEVFRPHAREFAGVLLDVTMPHLDGAATFRELRKIRPGLKVILSSGYDEHEATRRIVDEGLAGFLHKPYMPMDLIEKVREVLES